MIIHEYKVFLLYKRKANEYFIDTVQLDTFKTYYDILVKL